MSANANETIADIVTEFREMVHKSVDGIIAVKADVIADRIEAAWKRETQIYLDQIRDAMNQFGHEKFKSEHAPVGNAAAKKHRRTKSADPSRILHDYWRDHYEV